MGKTTMRISLIVIFALAALGLGKSLKDRAEMNARQVEAGRIQQIKTGIYQEIVRDMRNMVREEVRQEMALYLAQSKPASSSATGMDLSAVDSSALEGRQLMVRQVIRDILSQEMNVLAEDDLDSAYAGDGSEPDLRVAGQINKKIGRSEFELAAADTKTATDEKKAGTNAVAGDEKVIAQSLEQTVAQKGGILLPKGKLEWEPSFTWAHFSSNRINIEGFSILPVLVIGEISTETVKRDVMIVSNSFRYGLLDNLQGDLKIPARYEYDYITNTSSQDDSRGKGGIGDIEFGLSRQIGWEHGMMPDLIGALSVKTPTGDDPYNKDIGLGTGHWAVKPSLTWVKSSDPAVVFGSLSYAYNFARDIANYGEVKPGDTIGYSLGTAIALSYQVAINFSFEQNITFKMLKSDSYVPGSFLNSAMFKSGLTWAFNERFNCNVGIGFGITDDAPDTTVEFRFPYTF